jgi:hypothetical protein
MGCIWILKWNVFRTCNRCLMLIDPISIGSSTWGSSRSTLTSTFCALVLQLWDLQFLSAELDHLNLNVASDHQDHQNQATSKCSTENQHLSVPLTVNVKENIIMFRVISSYFTDLSLVDNYIGGDFLSSGRSYASFHAHMIQKVLRRCILVPWKYN